MQLVMAHDFSSAWLAMKETSHRDWQVIGNAFMLNFQTYAYVILPTLILYIAQGPYSLRVWTAAQHLSTAAEGSTLVDKKPQSWIKSTPFIGLAMFGFFGISAFLLRPELSISEILWASFACTVSTPFVVPVISKFLGVEKTVVVNGSVGLPVIHSVSRKTPFFRALEILTICAGFLITFFAFTFDNPSCFILVYISFLHTVAQARSQKTESIRTIMLFASGLIAGIAVTTISLVFVINRFGNTDQVPSDPKDRNGVFHDFSDASWTFCNMANAVIWAALPQALISICYRFDYANSLDTPSSHVSYLNPTDADSNATANEVDVAETVQLSETITLLASRSNSRTPISLPTQTYPNHNFPKPYYITTLLVWCIGNLIILYLASTDILPFGDAREHRASLGPGPSTSVYGVYGSMAAMMATPLMMLGVIGVACMRGEVKRMWGYKEQWGISVVMPDDNKNQAGEDELLFVEGD